MKAVVAAFNQVKALVGAFSVLTNPRMELFQALGVVCRGFIWIIRAELCLIVTRGEEENKTAAIVQ